MIDMFLEIGFELIKQKDGEVCYEREYKYYPDCIYKGRKYWL